MSVTVQVLDKTGRVLDTITGKCSESSIKVDATSLYRRTGSLTLSLDPELVPNPDSILWFGNRIKVYVGLEDLRHIPTEYVNFLMGTFYIQDGDVNYTASSNSLTIGLSDKMSEFTEQKLEEKLEIPAGTPIDVAIVKLMELLGETDFGFIEPSAELEVVPYKIQKVPGDKILDIITDIRDMYMDHYCYYNKKGQFEFRKVSVQKKDEVAVPKWTFDESKNTPNDLTVSFQEKYDLSKINNQIHVFGNTNSFGFTPDAKVTITDAKSPFNVDAIGKRGDVLVETTLSTIEQCLAKAKYELWKRSNFQEQCTIESVPLFFLEGTDIIEVVHPLTKARTKYIIDTVEFNLATQGTCSISAHKLYWVGVEYGEEVKPVVDAIVQGIKNMGWISLGEQRIKDSYGISGSGENELIVRFVKDKLGGAQASTTGYDTTGTQVLEIDLADYEKVVSGEANGDAGRGSGDFLDRVLAHEMFHAVLNDYLSVTVAKYIPRWFNEGFAELLIGGRERYESLNGYASFAEKKRSLIARADALLDNDWVGDSTDYTASFLLCAAIYKTLSTAEWQHLFQHLKLSTGLTVNFVNSVIESATSNEQAKAMIMNTLTTSDIWTRLEDKTDVDVLSVGGDYFLNLFGRKLDKDNVFNESDAHIDSLGFKLKIIM